MDLILRTNPHIKCERKPNTTDITCLNYISNIIISQEIAKEKNLKQYWIAFSGILHFLNINWGNYNKVGKNSEICSQMSALNL